MGKVLVYAWLIECPKCSERIHEHGEILFGADGRVYTEIFCKHCQTYDSVSINALKGIGKALEANKRGFYVDGNDTVN